MIEVAALRKNYRRIRGLDDFSLRIEKGELVGLVGPNGAGKTTLIKVLATLLPADSGAASVAGHDVFTHPRQVRAAAGYLPDVAGVYQDMRVGEFLEFFADAFHLKSPARETAINRALERSGLTARRGDFVEHLYLGWKQRLVLAKTLLHDPQVLLLDEPATGLDPLARVALRDQLKQLHAEGVTILISSHILADLEDICTRIVFISEGKNIAERLSAESAVVPAQVAPQATLCELQSSAPVETVTRAIYAIPGARLIETSNRLFRVEISGGVREAADFLRALLDAGVPVVFFDARGPDLEERYRRTFGGHSS
jgi:ABC-2 type transport system ATP-binding protein